MQEVSSRELSFNAFRSINEEWAVLVTQDAGKVNGMTVNWFQLGYLWNEDVVTVYVRPQRHTYPLINSLNTFSLCFLAQTPEAREQLAYLGSASGRDQDKLAHCGLLAAYDGATPYIQQARWVFICEILYQQDLDPQGFRDPAFRDQKYAEGDYHRMYVGRIKRVLAAQD